MTKHTSAPNPQQLQLFNPDTLEPEEIWKVVPGFDGRYEISNQGRLRRVKEKFTKGSWLPTIMKPSPDTAGYLRIGLMSPGKGVVRLSVHRLVAEIFLGPCPDGYEVNHKDLDKSNNSVSNLEYLTHFDNLVHARRNKKFNMPAGENNPSSKLTNEQADEIRVSPLSQRQLAVKYHVSQVAIHNIKAGITYKKSGGVDS